MPFLFEANIFEKCRFSHLHSFVFDIEMFLQDFSKDEMFELHDNLLTMTTKEESVAAFNKMVTISGVREWFGLMFKQPLQGETLPCLLFKDVCF